MVNFIPGTPKRYVIVKAIDIVTHAHDQQNDTTVCKIGDWS